MNKTPFSCRYAAQEVEYSILYRNQTDVKLFPLLKSNTGSTPLYNIGSTPFRSFVVSKIDDDGFIVSEGNGLSYTEWTFLNTGDFRTIIGVARNFLCHNVLAIFKVVVLPTLKMAKCLIVTRLRATPKKTSVNPFKPDSTQIQSTPGEILQ